jgi:NAD(P)-dependent dehydrogenase (short-subunit alcohol dehydrogenase family)
LVQREGVFVTVSSQAGLVGEAGNAIYSASKFALVGWSRALSLTGDSPRMRVVCPGMINTPLLVSAFEQMAVDSDVSFDDVLSNRLENVPAGRLGEPAEIGRAVTWLAELTTPACVVAAITGGEILF